MSCTSALTSLTGGGVGSYAGHRDRVIARLLDGWEHDVLSAKPTWWKDNGIDYGNDIFAPMSDGEAAIIRQHQERST